MSEKEIVDNLLKQIYLKESQFKQDPSLRVEFMKDVGILNADGSLSDNYKEPKLCPDQ